MQNICVLGAKTLVGRELISILEQRDFPLKKIYLHDVAAVEGEESVFKGRSVDLHSHCEEFLNEVELVFCCQDKVRARPLINKFKQRALVIDLSGASQFVPAVPHIIPEINGQDLKEHKGVVANPNPMTIQLLLPLYPLHKKYTLNRLHVTALSAVSAYGIDAINELDYEYEFLAVGEEIAKAEDGVFPYSIGSNVIPQMGDFDRDGHTEKESLVAREAAMILDRDDILITTTCMWVPVRRANCTVVYAGFENEISLADAGKLLNGAAGIKFMKGEEYPTPEYVVGKDEVFVGRLREDVGFENGLAMWIVADNLRKGSALNAVQIAEQINL
jgi:aspartate-semialdehyde dehydrogenase